MIRLCVHARARARAFVCVLVATVGGGGGFSLVLCYGVVRIREIRGRLVGSS